MSAQLTMPARDFAALREVVWQSDRSCFVVREQQAANEGGAHVYRAYELTQDRAYGDLCCDCLFGRVDTLRPTTTPAEYTEAVAWLMCQQARARQIIRQLCPETVPGEAVYDGPGYVTLLTRPDRRYQTIIASRRPF